MKSLAVAGFVGVILLIAFLVVKIIGFLPSAFTSLASLADGVYNNTAPEIQIVGDESVVNAGESIGIQWSEATTEGNFVFNYECTEGIAVTLIADNDSRSVNCDTDYDLGTLTEASLVIDSEKNRFSDLTYTIGFSPENTETVLVRNDDVITVVNASISSLDTIVMTDEEDIVTEESTEEGVSGEVAGETDTTEEPNESSETPDTPVPIVVEEIIYKIPTSNPYGTTDLAVRYLGVGTLDSNNRFIPTASIDNDERGAFQFEVKNLGTKTSDEWSFVAVLPTGMEYDAPVQAPLRPNERSVLTLGFDVANNTEGLQEFGVLLNTTNDTNPNNDIFDWAVVIEN